MPNSVFPQPAPPQTSVARPFSRPPRVISSNPCMPVCTLLIPLVTGSSQLDPRERGCAFTFTAYCEAARRRTFRGAKNVG
jgi:hypothetical protein